MNVFSAVSVLLSVTFPLSLAPGLYLHGEVAATVMEVVKS
jgi:hypothetical protein